MRNVSAGREISWIETLHSEQRVSDGQGWHRGDNSQFLQLRNWDITWIRTFQRGRKNLLCSEFVSPKFFPAGFGGVCVGCRKTKHSRGMQRGDLPLLGLPTPGQVGFPQFSLLFGSFNWEFFRNLLKWVGWDKLSLEDEDGVSCTRLCSSNPSWK